MLYNKACKVAASEEREVDFDLGGCMEDLVSVQDNSPTPVIQVVILQSSTCFDRILQTFSYLRSKCSCITSQLQYVSRLVVWDEHLADSLKAEARTRRGKCIRRRISLH